MTAAGHDGDSVNDAQAAQSAEAHRFADCEDAHKTCKIGITRPAALC